jgi:chemotaxis protein MotB
MTNLQKVFAVTCLIFLVGCVSAKEHKARLQDIDLLKYDVETLKKEKSDLEKELATTKKEKSDLEKELATTKKDYEEVSLNFNKLTEDKTELRDLLAEKDLKIRQLDEELDLRDIKIKELEAKIDALYLEKDRVIEESQQEISELKSTYDDLTSELHDKIVEGEIEITQLKDKLTVKMVDKILFASGSANVKKDGKKVLSQVAEILKKVEDRQILVEGHTDNVQISSRLREKFPSNWELSTARATNVVRYLQDAGGIDPTILSAVGYGEYRPVASNETKEGKAKNRRIAIVLIPIEVAKAPVEE